MELQYHNQNKELLKVTGRH